MEYLPIIITIALSIFSILNKNYLKITIPLIIIGGASQIYLTYKTNQEKEKATLYGVLKPSNKSVKKNTNSKIFKDFEFGDSGAGIRWLGPEGVPLFKILRDSHITIGMENDKLYVSTILRNDTGTVVAELIKNEWRINPNGYFDRNFSADALEVKDLTGEIVLQVKVMGDRVQFQGVFTDKSGASIGFGKASNLEPGKKGGHILGNPPGYPRVKLNIKPMFKYPSDSHLGELAN